MGEDDPFLNREGISDLELVRTLHEVRLPSQDGGHASGRISDPELLARLIDGECGTDFSFRLADLDDQVRHAGNLLFDQLPSLKEAADKLLGLDRKANVPILEQAAARLIAEGVPEERRAAAVQRLISSLETLAEWPQRSKSPFGGRPRHYETAKKVIRAVAEYCERVGIPFRAPAHVSETNTQPQRFRMTEAAHLALSVLEACKPLSQVASAARVDGSETDRWPATEKALVSLMNEVRRERMVKTSL